MFRFLISFSRLVLLISSSNKTLISSKSFTKLLSIKKYNARGEYVTSFSLTILIKFLTVFSGSSGLKFIVVKLNFLAKLNFSFFLKAS